MKEATGELNSTVIVVIAVSILVAFFYMVIWPMLKKNMDQNSKCSDAWCEKCTDSSGCKMVVCHYGDNNDTIMCPWKG